MYKYILLNNCPISNPDYTENYYNLCFHDLYHDNRVYIVPFPTFYLPRIYQISFWIYNHNYRFFSFPAKKVWFPYYFKNPFHGEKLCFIISGSYYSLAYMRYLKQAYKECKIVLLHRDLIENDKRFSYINNKDLDSIVDVRITYDEEQARQYGIRFYPQVASKLYFTENSSYSIDLFFCGKGKDRFPRLLEIYKAFVSNGKKCLFCLTEIPPSDQIKMPGIVYMNKEMNYKKMIEYSLNAKCILDLNQRGATGYTSRVLEAIMYGRLLLTDNPSILKSKFYHPLYMNYYTNCTEISADFIPEDFSGIDYGYEDEFSPIRLIDYIESIL